MKRPFEFVAEIQDKDAEIERLKNEFQKAKEWNQFSEIQIKNLQDIVEAQSDLLTRAADALEKYTSYPIGMAMSVSLRESGRSLIAELRKGRRNK